MIELDSLLITEELESWVITASIIQIGLPISAILPTGTKTFFKYPAIGEGTSVSILSVATSTINSSAST